MCPSLLSDASLWYILDRFPARLLFCMHRISDRLRGLQSSACKRRNSLTLLVGKDVMSRLYNSHLLSADEKSHLSHSAMLYNAVSVQFDAHSCQVIGSAFPQVSSLALVLSDTPLSDVVHLIGLLRQWSSHLKSLKLWLRMSAPIDNSSSLMFDLIRQVNHLPELKQLLFEYEGSFYRWVSNTTFGLTLPVDQLQQLRFFSYDDGAILVRSLRGCSEQTLSLLQVGNPIRWDVATFLSCCSVLYTVDTLWLALETTSLARLCQWLAHFPYLTHLKLEIDFHKRDGFSAENVQPTSVFPPLPSIETLTLFLSVRTHDDLRSRHLGNIFPNLTRMQLFVSSGSGCSTCNAKNKLSTTQLSPFCQQKMCQVWKDQCTKLTQVSLINWDPDQRDEQSSQVISDPSVQCHRCGKLGHSRGNCAQIFNYVNGSKTIE